MKSLQGYLDLWKTSKSAVATATIYEHTHTYLFRIRTLQARTQGYLNTIVVFFFFIRFYKFLVDANKDPHIKTCPRCSHVMTVNIVLLRNPKHKKKGLKVNNALEIKLDHFLAFQHHTFSRNLAFSKTIWLIYSIELNWTSVHHQFTHDKGL